MKPGHMDLGHLLSDLIITFLGLQASAVILTTTYLVLSNRDVPSTVGWTGLVLLTPLVGVALYWVFGINRIQRKAH